MAGVNACSGLVGQPDVDSEVRSFAELEMIAGTTNSVQLELHLILYQIALNCWMRKYQDVAKLSEKYNRKQSISPQKSAWNIYRMLFEGIAYLNLARETKQAGWKTLGEKAMLWMSQMETISKWNYENKTKLLQAELHYSKGELESAEASYEASINSAHEHKFIHEEAWACELYGVFCIQNNLAERGNELIKAALDKYTQWGAMEKVTELQKLIDASDAAMLMRRTQSYGRATF